MVQPYRSVMAEPHRFRGKIPLVWRWIMASSLWIATILGIGPGTILQPESQYAYANPNFGRVRIAASSSQAIQGYTSGSVSLAAAITPEDQRNRPCVGYADSNPDHILELTEQARQITIAVDSNGNDTTLLIQSPDGAIYCGDDEGEGADALVQGRNWPAGEYKVWVGAFEPGVRYDYTLQINL
jgi:hypothetical protein